MATLCISLPELARRQSCDASWVRGGEGSPPASWGHPGRSAEGLSFVRLRGGLSLGESALVGRALMNVRGGRAVDEQTQQFRACIVAADVHHRLRL